ncbi:MAG: hypothetical protein F6J94_23595 [Moorea sp. SIO1F2]|uniref:hypothetical protein n=1 Tax=Moorena sp. SIO1F2 TaxID=2607819 RepID=UPI0013B66878|nr:hypothetical protein [Moorena sp. SIO1F2]NEO61388.1 hypothetical protein [Moorena sp. SIO4G2]NET84789.1 hypothetical protein [Moorena sp. SIO1F2]
MSNSYKMTFSDLHHRKTQGHLRMVGTGGVARSLTTAIARMLSTQPSKIPNQPGYLFDISLNESFSWGEQRIVGGYEHLLHLVQHHESQATATGRDLRQIPLQVLSKNNSHHFSKQQWQNFLALIDIQLLQIRNPALTFASQVTTTLDLILERYILESNRTQLELAKNTGDFSKLQLSAFKTDIPESFVELIKVQKANHAKDFSNPEFDSHFFRINFAIHRCIDHNQKLEIWQEARQKNSPEELDHHVAELGFPGWDVMIEQSSLLPWSQLYQLPKLLHEPLETYRTGWQAIPKVIQACSVTQTPLILFDATDAQLFPDQFLLAVQRALVILGILPSPLREPSNFSAEDITQLSNPAFARALRSRQLHQPLKSPIPLEQLPKFIRPSLTQAFQIYLDVLINGGEAIWFPKIENLDRLFHFKLSHGKTILETDPVYAYSRAVIHQIKQGKTEYVELIRHKYPVFEAYYEMIDQAIA